MAERFKSVSLVKMEKGRENQFSIRVHDLLIDVAMQKNSECERIGWFRSLRDNYNPKERSRTYDGEVNTPAVDKFVRTPWWSVADDGFLHDNICRILEEEELYRELL